MSYDNSNNFSFNMDSDIIIKNLNNAKYKIQNNKSSDTKNFNNYNCSFSDIIFFKNKYLEKKHKKNIVVSNLLSKKYTNYNNESLKNLTVSNLVLNIDKNLKFYKKILKVLYSDESNSVSLDIDVFIPKNEVNNLFCNNNTLLNNYDTLSCEDLLKHKNLIISNSNYIEKPIILYLGIDRFNKSLYELLNISKLDYDFRYYNSNYIELKNNKDILTKTSNRFYCKLNPIKNSTTNNKLIKCNQKSDSYYESLNVDTIVKESLHNNADIKKRIDNNNKENKFKSIFAKSLANRLKVLLRNKDNTEDNLNLSKQTLIRKDSLEKLRENKKYEKNIRHEFFDSSTNNIDKNINSNKKIKLNFKLICKDSDSEKSNTKITSDNLCNINKFRCKIMNNLHNNKEYIGYNNNNNNNFKNVEVVYFDTCDDYNLKNKNSIYYNANNFNSLALKSFYNKNKYKNQNTINSFKNKIITTDFINKKFKSTALIYANNSKINNIDNKTFSSKLNFYNIIDRNNNILCIDNKDTNNNSNNVTLYTNSSKEEKELKNNDNQLFTFIDKGNSNKKLISNKNVISDKNNINILNTEILSSNSINDKLLLNMNNRKSNFFLHKYKQIKNEKNNTINECFLNLYNYNNLKIEPEYLILISDNKYNININSVTNFISTNKQSDNTISKSIMSKDHFPRLSINTKNTYSFNKLLSNNKLSTKPFFSNLCNKNNYNLTRNKLKDLNIYLLNLLKNLIKSFIEEQIYKVMKNISLKDLFITDIKIFKDISYEYIPIADYQQEFLFYSFISDHVSKLIKNNFSSNINENNSYVIKLKSTKNLNNILNTNKIYDFKHFFLSSFDNLNLNTAYEDYFYKEEFYIYLNLVILIVQETKEKGELIKKYCERKTFNSLFFIDAFLFKNCVFIKNKIHNKKNIIVDLMLSALNIKMRLSLEDYFNYKIYFDQVYITIDIKKKFSYLKKVMNLINVTQKFTNNTFEDFYKIFNIKRNYYLIIKDIGVNNLNLFGKKKIKNIVNIYNRFYYYVQS